MRITPPRAWFRLMRRLIVRDGTTRGGKATSVAGGWGRGSHFVRLGRSGSPRGSDSRLVLSVSEGSSHLPAFRGHPPIPDITPVVPYAH